MALFAPYYSKKYFCSKDSIQDNSLKYLYVYYQHEIF